MQRFEIGTLVSEAQNSVEATYQIVYCEVIDYTVNAIQWRFDQDGYKVLCKLEELLCDPKCRLNECNEILDQYGKDFDLDRLAIQLSVLHCNPFEVHSQTGGMKLNSIIQFLKQLNSAQRQLYTEVLKLAQFILVMQEANAVSERTCSALRRLKTWLRSIMHQTQLNCMMHDFTCA